MSERLTALLSDLQRVVQQLNDHNRKEAQILDGETLTQEPAAPLDSDTKPAEKKIDDVSDLIIKADGQVPGLVIGVDADKDSAMRLERVEVIPEPDGRVRITVRAKKEEAH
jgi:hypothetical protein